jgi:hypothetical protein
MSSATVLNTLFGYDVCDSETDHRCEEGTSTPSAWNCRRFGQEQIRSLVQQIFFSGGAKTPRQVVFSGVDQSANVEEICLQVGHVLSAQTSGNVCIVDAIRRPLRIKESGDIKSQVSIQQGQEFDCIRDSALMASKRLWLVPSDVFFQSEKILSAAWLRGRLDELRLDFDYAIFQTAPTGQCSDGAILGHLCDGVVLMLTANSTRRVAAMKVKDRLFSANARLLGTVLSNRSFPIPEGIYRRL